MVNLTINDLTHQKGKLILILIGLFSSVFLIQFSFGMYFGSISEFSRMSDEYGHEAWVTQEDMEMLMVDGFVDNEIYEEIKDIKGVKQADRIIMTGGSIEGLNDVTYITIVGLDLSNDHITPWDTYDKDYDDLLDKVGTIILDESILSDMSDLEKGDKINMDNVVDFEVVDFSSGGNLMGTPWGWCSLETAELLYPWVANFSTSIGIVFEDNYDFKDFKDDTKDIEGISVYTSQEIKDNTDEFIMEKLGVGMIIYLMAGMGFIVGIIIIAITTYQGVLEKIPVFGTMKALGAEKKLINRMLFGQTFIYMTVSFIIGTLLAMVLGSSAGTMKIVVDLQFSIWMYITLLATSFVCAYASVRTVHKIDPAVVFRR